MRSGCTTATKWRSCHRWAVDSEAFRIVRGPVDPRSLEGAQVAGDGGVIAERRGRFRPFYGCVNYPACDFTLSARPIPEACPKCGNPEAYWVLRQTRGADEPETRIFECTKCGHKWREYQ